MSKPETPARVGSSDVLAAVSLLGLVIWASATIIMMITLKIEWLIVAVCGVPIWTIPLLIMSWQRHKAANTKLTDRPVTGRGSERKDGN